ncbi:MAG TPA: OmpA family protein [Xanthomonadales bacterium]|nr:OmpA family protein [Xanthomonadales bacterium]
MNRIFQWTATGILALTLVACSTPPQRVDTLENARTLVAEVDREPMAEKIAGAELDQAKQQLAEADAALENRDSMTSVQHHAYLALRHAEIARERIAEAKAREQIASAEAERADVLLMARTREADRARMLAESRELEAARAKAQAEAEALEAQRARALAETRSRELEQQEIEARIAREQADMALAEAQLLQDELETLKAEQTIRGLVLTLNGGVLFDTDKAVLKPGAELTLDRLAAFMAEYPERNLMVEGHTDATGDDAYNIVLSSERADAVRNALVARGIEEFRIRTMGLGENYPVASNDSNAGRQLNRRVEIVLSNDDGLFPDGAVRTVSSR